MSPLCHAWVFFMSFIGLHSGEVLLTEDSPWTVLAGTTAAVICRHPNTTNYTVSWLKQEQSDFTARNKTLRFQNVQVENHGNYTCVIEENDTVLDNRTLEIRVSYPPENISISVNNRHDTKTNYTISGGDNATLVCSVYGFPPPLITWRKDEVVIKKEDLTGRYGVHQPPTDGFTSVFNVISAWLDDSGTYTCTASNTANDSLQVGVRLDVPKYFPALRNQSKQSRTYRVVEGESAVVKFTVVSNPESLVAKWSLQAPETEIDLFNKKGDNSKWFRKNRTISTNIQLFEFYHVNVTQNMTGFYTVILTNGLRLHLCLDYNISIANDSTDTTVQKFITTEGYNNTAARGEKDDGYCDSKCRMLPYLIAGVIVGALLFLVLLSCCLRVFSKSIVSHSSIEDIFSELDDSMVTIRNTETGGAKALHPIAPQYTFRETNDVTEC